MRIDPPPSEPVASGTIPAAMAAALPPEDPPGVWSRFHGLRVGPNTVLSVSAFHPSSGVLVFPTTTHPAATSRATSGRVGRGRRAVGEGRRAVGGDEAGGVLQVLHPERDAGQRARVATGGHLARRSPSAAARARSSSTATKALSRGLCSAI